VDAQQSADGHGADTVPSCSAGARGSAWMKTSWANRPTGPARVITRRDGIAILRVGAARKAGGHRLQIPLMPD